MRFLRALLAIPIIVVGTFGAFYGLEPFAYAACRGTPGFVHDPPTEFAALLIGLPLMWGGYWHFWNELLGPKKQKPASHASQTAAEYEVKEPLQEPMIHLDAIIFLVASIVLLCFVLFPSVHS